MMKVAHFSVFGPRQCGLYHTAKDLVLAERSVGIDARFVAVDEQGKVSVHRDGSFETEKLQWAYGADILVRHSVIPGHIQNSGKPIVMCLHGRPESSLRLEQQKSTEVISGVANKANDCRYKAFVTFWPEYVDLWRSLVGEKVCYVPACVNLDEWQATPRPGVPNILIADIWREDITPFNCILAAQRFCRLHPEARLYILGMPKDVVTPMRHILRECKSLVEVRGQTSDIQKYYALADMVVTPHLIATRIVREAMACDVPIVGGEGAVYTPFTANPNDVDGIVRAMESCWKDRPHTRSTAETMFGLPTTGRAIKGLFENLITRGAGKTKRKVFVDIGAHVGETVRRFYREKPDAHEYEIYCFEPDRPTFTELDKTVGHIPNVDLINAAAATKDGLVNFYPGRVNQNEGGTTIKGKETGAVDYSRPVTVETVDFVRWLRVNHGDVTIVKMNIEGAEYDLLEQMLDAGVTDLIDECYVQLHAHKFQHGPQRQKFQRIEGRFFNEAKCKCFFRNKGFASFHADIAQEV